MSREAAPRSERQADDTSMASAPTTEVHGAEQRFTSAGAVPPVAAGPAPAHAPTASELAFGPIQLDPNAPPKPVAPLPLADAKDLKARATRMQAEQLLNAKDLEITDHAMQAVQLLLDLPADERAKAIDGLGAKAFANLLDNVPEDQRERFAGLVDASQDPKRKLQMWAAFHKARAKNDLRRYEGNFGDEETRSDAQQAKFDQHERRQRGVDGDATEVDDEVAHLLAKDKHGALTVADVDAMRARKDLELDVEMKHNVNLTAEKAARSDGSQVAWSTDELHGFDHALGKLPDTQAHGAHSVETFQRRANPFLVTKGGEYLTDHVDVYDNAHHQDPAGGGDTFEHTVTHEIGHDVAHDHGAAFEKFKATAGWKTLDEKGLERAHLGEDQRDQLDRRRRQAETTDEKDRDVAANDKIYQPGSKRGEYLAVDASAMPDAPEWRYGKTNADEQFAEMYAKAVDDPGQLYRDFIAEPTKHATEARARVDQLRAEVTTVSGDQLATKRVELAAAERAAATTARIQKQRASELGIMREDVFHTQKAANAASARLHAQHVNPDKIAAFERDAARAMTPAQIAELEQKANG